MCVCVCVCVYIYMMYLKGSGCFWCFKKFISIPNNKLHAFPIRVITVKFNALSHSSLPRFYALLEGFFEEISFDMFNTSPFRRP